VIKYNKRKRPDIARNVVRSLEHGLKISLETFHSLGEFEKTAQVEIDTKSLQLLMAAVETEKLRKNEEIYSPKDVEAAESNENFIRDVLNFDGVTVRAVILLSAHDEGVVQSSLNLINTLLEDGHRECQTSIFDYFVASSEEHFFVIVRTRLQESTISIKEARVLAQMKQARFSKEKELAQATKASRTQKHHSRDASVHASEGAIEMAAATEDDEERDDVDGEILTFSQVVGIVRPIFRMLQVCWLFLFFPQRKQRNQNQNQKPKNQKKTNEIWV